MELLNKICGITAVSGFEYRGIDALKNIFDSIFDDTRLDSNYNLSGYFRCGKKDAPLVMLEAHFDSIGLMVKQIHDGGFVTFIAIGGVDPRILPGSEVILHGSKDILGICGAKPPHILTAEDMKAGVTMDDLCIDTGYTKDELETIIEIGTPVTIAPAHFCLSGEKFCGSYLDDRAGIYTVLRAAQLIKTDIKTLGFDLCVLATTTEETGQYGARCAAADINPELAVVVDVTHGDTPDGIKGRTSPLGGGGVVCMGPNLSLHYNDILFDALEKSAIPYQTEVEEGSTGTNAWVIQTAAFGIPCVLVSIPLKYMHTNIEVVSTKDLTLAAEAIACFLKAVRIDGGDIDA